MLSPNALSPSGNPEAEQNPFESEFVGDEDELDEEAELVGEDQGGDIVIALYEKVTLLVTSFSPYLELKNWENQFS